MRNKKGFVFIETIITIVVLTTTLVLLYATYSATLINEKQMLYYDDIAYIYKTLQIREVLNNSIDSAKFDSAYQKKRKGEYIYIFGTESKIYTDNTLIKEAMDRFQFTRMMYVDVDDVSKLKDCVDGKPEGSEIAICNKTLLTIDGYSSANFLDYLKNVDIINPRIDRLPEGYGSLDTKIKGVLIVLYYEAKNGGERVPEGGYEGCIQKKVFANPVLYQDNPSWTNAQRLEKKQAALDLYYKTETINYSMHCENAYYTAWVYL